MSDPIPTRPPTESESLLKQKFTETLVNQVDLMDKLGQQLITLELAIPGVYATVLKLVSGEDATMSRPWALFATFGCWFLALALTLCSLFPKEWQVNTSVLKQAPHSNELGLEDFFYKVAQRKLRFLIPACICFFAGIVFAAWTIF